MSKKEKNEKNKKVFKYPKPKRTHKEAFPHEGEKAKNSYFQKKKKVPSKLEASIITKKEEEIKIYDLKYLYQNIIETDNRIQLKKKFYKIIYMKRIFMILQRLLGTEIVFLEVFLII